MINNNEEGYQGIKTIARSWARASFVLFITLSGIILSLMCIYSLPDYSVKPEIGSVFYLLSSITIAIYLITQWRSSRTIQTRMVNEIERSSVASISDKILKWVVTMFALSSIFLSFGIALICIYGLPDHSVHVEASAVYFIGGLTVIVTLIHVVWRNWQ